MRTKETEQTISEVSPSSASTAVAAAMFRGDMLTRAEKLVIDADLTGGTGGTLDIYLQRKTGTNAWRDLVHFPQLADGAPTKRYSLTITGDGASIVEVGGGTDAAPGVALTANAVVNVIPGGDVRLVFVAGTGTTAGATQQIKITPFTELK